MNNRKILLSLTLGLVIGLLMVGAFAAQAGNNPSTLHGASYEISWWTVDGGGGTVAGSGYTLMGTAGQPEAGTAITGGGYTLASGFWHASGLYRVFAPLILK